MFLHIYALGTHFADGQARGAKLLSSSITEKAAERGMSRTFYANVRHLEGWDVLYNILFCYIEKFLLHNRNLFVYIAFNLMLYSICYITYAT